MIALRLEFSTEGAGVLFESGTGSSGLLAARYSCPGRIWSLLELHELQARKLLDIGAMLQSFYTVPDAEAGMELDDAMSSRWNVDLFKLKKDCDELGLEHTGVLAESYLLEYASSSRTFADLKRSVSALNAKLVEELEKHLFLQLDPERIKYWRATPEAFAADPVFGRKVAELFSSTNDDAREAGTCFAVHRNTACVFHCMRVLERGLRAFAAEVALATSVPVVLPVPFEYQEWHTIIERVEREIKILEKRPRTKEKADTLKFYSEAGSQFFFFKNAWRNHVSHARESYGDEEAKTVFEHVDAFMNYLAAGGLHD